MEKLRLNGASMLAMRLSNLLSDGTFDRTRDVGEAFSASENHPVHMLGL